LSLYSTTATALIFYHYNSTYFLLLQHLATYTFKVKKCIL